MTHDRVTQLVGAALETLGVADRVRVGDVTPDGSNWKVALAFDGPPASIAVPDDDDEARAARAIRDELRRALRLCPLCQRMGRVEKIRDASGRQEACAVRCPACGDYEIDQALIRTLRSAWERGEASVLARLPLVAEGLRSRPAADRRLTAADFPET